MLLLRALKGKGLKLKKPSCMVGGVWEVSFGRELHGEGAILWTGSERSRMVSFITSQLLISADEYFCYSRLRPERQIRGEGGEEKVG